MKDREVWQPYLELLPRNHHKKAGNEEKEKSSYPKGDVHLFLIWVFN